MRHLVRSTMSVLLAPVVITLSACGVTSTDGDAATGVRSLEIVVGNSPGGGYDTMARQIADVLQGEGIVGEARVTNKPGAGGTVALQQLVNMPGEAETLMTTGVAVTGALSTSDSPLSMTGATPIARILEEPMIIAVAKDSPYQNIGDLLAAWKAEPRRVTAGGGAIAGPDHQQVLLLAQAAGIDIRQVNFVTYDGGGELLPAVLGQKVAFTASGYAEWAHQIDSGEIRVLAVSSAERVETIDAPTLKEQGVDLVFSNWRGFLAPPGLSPEQETALTAALAELHESQAWQERLRQNGQLDAFLAGDEFDGFVEEEQRRVKQLATEAGLA
ncbi:Bug family tripartite tricarboxylate transporter substrate binding protein [Pseudonocardia zijingensis]|jgi:putative tricarboxylic transport membrane protein|uniref:Tripartite tricarboxylate transporter substrate-binding protein n=1 Tax=Pseudonocardia zijingensis TaxID=153376 RepID=A0ABN1NYC2_9PSEU